MVYCNRPGKTITCKKLWRYKMITHNHTIHNTIQYTPEPGYNKIKQKWEEFFLTNFKLLKLLKQFKNKELRAILAEHFIYDGFIKSEIKNKILELYLDLLEQENLTPDKIDNNIILLLQE